MMSNNHFTLYVLIFFCAYGCAKPEKPNNSPLNLSDQFIECNDNLQTCNASFGSYCLFGLKWGVTNPIPFSGPNVVGPKESGGTITFSFQEQHGLVNTHAQINLPSESFDNLPACAKTEIKNALAAWATEANLDFEQMPDNSDSDIKFFVADIRQSGIGYPNYSDDYCRALAGMVVIKKDLSISNCNTLYNFFLHEIGHVLGLGHVNTNNIMNSDFSVFNSFNGLQAGDKLGIIQLYGDK